MQTISKVNNTDGFVIGNINRNALTMPRRCGLFTLVLTVSLLLTTGCARDEPTTPTPLAPSSSELDNTEHNVQQRSTRHSNSELDNTRRNARDSSGSTLTPLDQGGTRGDRRITAAIRRTIVKNKSLSLDAHNAKIITQHGVVTLRGPVESAAEKTKLQSIAQKIRGVKQVDNQLEIKTP